jgi:hypothetical protein
LEKSVKEEWLLVYQERWYVWIPLSLYDVSVELFMAILGFGGFGTGIGYLLGFVSIPNIKTTPAWQFYGGTFSVLLFAAWLGWNGLRGAWIEIQAVFTPALVFEGTLDQITTEIRSGKNTNYPVRVLKAGDKTWEIYKGDLDHSAHSWQIKAGKQVRIQYRRGTEQITHISVK